MQFAVDDAAQWPAESSSETCWQIHCLLNIAHRLMFRTHRVPSLRAEYLYVNVQVRGSICSTLCCCVGTRSATPVPVPEKACTVPVSRPLMSLKMDKSSKSIIKYMYFKSPHGIMSLMKDTPLRNVEQLGAAIRSARKEQGLSQSALAARLGVERKWILRLEAGNRAAELGLVLRTLETLGMQAYLSDPTASGTGVRDSPASQLDEVFRRLQRTGRK